MKLKQCISIFLTLLFTLVTVAGVAPAAHARACNHEWGDTSTTSQYLQVDSSEHEHRITTRKVCRICGFLDLDTKRIFESHSIRFYDLGHDYTNHTHSYRTGCSQCGYTASEQTVSCPGPPCPQPQSLRPIFERQ